MNHKKTIEIAMLGGSLVMSMAAFDANASAVCAGGSATSISGATTNFVKTGFAPKCSASTLVNAVDGGSDYAVRGASAKGKIAYGAGTAGGQVTACSTFPSSAPSAADPSTASGTGC